MNGNGDTWYGIFIGFAVTVILIIVLAGTYSFGFDDGWRAASSLICVQKQVLQQRTHEMRCVDVNNIR